MRWSSSSAAAFEGAQIRMRGFGATFGRLRIPHRDCISLIYMGFVKNYHPETREPQQHLQCLHSERPGKAQLARTLHGGEGPGESPAEPLLFSIHDIHKLDAWWGWQCIRYRRHKHVTYMSRKKTHLRSRASRRLSWAFAGSLRVATRES